jgi:quinolinate synthase
MTPDVQQMYDEMKSKLSRIVPDVELRYKAEIAVEINALKVQRNAVILGHNYMEPALFHSIPDFTGDSLDLSRKAAQTDKDVIVFCGVRFMAETAKILNPSKTILLPAAKAGCSLAESISAASDICCTSSNAAAVVESLHTDTVIFLPDEYLAKNVARDTGKHIIFPSLTPHSLGKSSRADDEGNLDYQLIGWHGRCEVHEKFTVKDIESVRAQFPDVVILAHPECSPEVTLAANFSGSTNAMIRYVQQSKAPRYLLLTECAMGDNVAAANPQKEMLRLCMVRCPHMNMITMEETRDALKFNRYVIEVPEDIRLRAYQAVERMIKIG